MPSGIITTYLSLRLLVIRGFLDIYPTFCRDQPRTTELPNTRKLDQSIQARFSVLIRRTNL